MRFGVTLVSPLGDRAPEASVASGAYLSRVARHAEEVGFDSVWLPDHVVVPVGYESDYPYQPAGAPRIAFEDIAIPEPMIALAYAAAATERLELRTGVLILPERNPVVLAKQVATLDALSGGRVALGVGLGWMREEYAAVGVPWEGRGRRCDEYLEAMRALWTQDEATYQGETVSFDRVRCLPRPARPGGVPLIVGGHSEAAARRAGRLGDGFLPAAGRRDDHPRLIAAMRAAASAAGRDPDAIELSCGGVDDYDGLRAIEALGFRHVHFAIMETDVDRACAALEGLADRLLRRFA